LRGLYNAAMNQLHDAEKKLKQKCISTCMNTCCPINLMHKE